MGLAQFRLTAARRKVPVYQFKLFHRASKLAGQNVLSIAKNAKTPWRMGKIQLTGHGSRNALKTAKGFTDRV